MQKFCIAIFPLNSLQNQQQKMDHSEILHFNLEIGQMQKFCMAIFQLNSLKNQQQTDNAEILHFNFDTYKIWVQKFCRASFRQNHYKNNITKLVSKCVGGINEQVLKTSGFDVLSSRKKTPKNLRGGQLAPPPPSPPALIHPRVKVEFPAVNFSLRKQPPSLLSVLI